MAPLIYHYQGIGVSAIGGGEKTPYFVMRRNVFMVDSHRHEDTNIYPTFPKRSDDAEQSIAGCR